MIFQTKNNSQIELRRLLYYESEELSVYLQKLSPETRRRFGPHGFSRQSIEEIFNNSKKFRLYVAVTVESCELIAYSIIKIGYLGHDSQRLQSYGLNLDENTDCTYAPSVADNWQSQGIGNALFLFILGDLKHSGIKRIILWGGVQSDNQKAVRFYLKNGFKMIGQFEYNGLNDDMMLEIA